MMILHSSPITVAWLVQFFTALAAQDWYYGQHGERLHWPVDHYQEEGLRQARFLDHDVVKYHRTLATYLNTVIEAGFTIVKLSEPQPAQEMLDKHPDMRDDTRRPMFLLIAAVRNEGSGNGSSPVL